MNKKLIFGLIILLVMGSVFVIAKEVNQKIPFHLRDKYFENTQEDYKDCIQLNKNHLECQVKLIETIDKEKEGFGTSEINALKSVKTEREIAEAEIKQDFETKEQELIGKNKEKITDKDIKEYIYLKEAKEKIEKETDDLDYFITELEKINKIRGKI